MSPRIVGEISREFDPNTFAQRTGVRATKSVCEGDIQSAWREQSAYSERYRSVQRGRNGLAHRTCRGGEWRVASGEWGGSGVTQRTAVEVGRTRWNGAWASSRRCPNVHRWRAYRQAIRDGRYATGTVHDMSAIGPDGLDSTAGCFFLSPSLAVMRNQLSARYSVHCADQLTNYDSFSQVRSLHARITPLRGTTRHAHSRLKFPL